MLQPYLNSPYERLRASVTSERSFVVVISFNLLHGVCHRARLRCRYDFFFLPLRSRTWLKSPVFEIDGRNHPGWIKLSDGSAVIIVSCRGAGPSGTFFAPVARRWLVLGRVIGAVPCRAVIDFTTTSHTPYPRAVEPDPGFVAPFGSSSARPLQVRRSRRQQLDAFGLLDLANHRFLRRNFSVT